MDQSPEQVFLPLAGIVFEESAFQSTLQQVVDLAAASLKHCSMAGMTLLGRSGPETAVATDEVAGRVDAVQYEVNSGPCLDAYRHQTVYRIDSTAKDQHWPEFSHAALAVGVRSTLSFPLVVRGDGIGALNLCSDVESGFDDLDEGMGAVFAKHASVTLANARAYWRIDDLRQNLEQVLESRGVIEQAKGIMMAREGYNADEAFDILRRRSQRSNRKIHELAQEIVDTTKRGQ